MMTLFASSCSDMLEVESSREVEMPEINQKTDSLFFAAGIMEAMQRAAEVYLIQNEMRGDLVTTTEHSDNNLRSLANFTAGTTNKYDSAYVYYKVVNNCNYYIAHRDTALYDGATNVTLEEYAAVLSFRAWAYLQLARTYGRVKFFTKPLTALTQIENDNSPELGIEEITQALEGDLKKFANTGLPYGNTVLPGTGVLLVRCCIPVNVILGDLYLESGRYPDAAHCYYEYFFNNKVVAENLLNPYVLNGSLNPRNDKITRPNDINLGNRTYTPWFSSTYSMTSYTELANVITYVPMAVNSREGYTSEFQKFFGYNFYYTADRDRDSILLEKKQIVPSKAYYAIADSADFYYLNNDLNPQYKVIEKFGDMRATAREVEYERSSSNTIEKFIRMYTYGLITNNNYVNSPCVYLYRTTTIWLHLAEALNRMGYPDAAFAILKDGLKDDVLDYGYIRKPTYELLTTGTLVPFCLKLENGGQSEQSILFSGSTHRNYGIHRYGCSDNLGMSTDRSLYRMTNEVENKIAELQRIFSELGSIEKNTERADRRLELKQEIDALNGKEELTDDEKAKLASLNTELTELEKDLNSLGVRNLNDVINAIEDIICDEYAMETAFEGSRFADLARIARHKNGDDTYGSNFGSKWLAEKLKANNPGKDLTNPDNWYLPFK